MSSVGTAKKFAWLEVLRSFWKADTEIDDEDIKSIETIDTKFDGISEKDFEELKKSSKIVNELEKRYSEERYSIDSKKIKTKKVSRTKTADIKVKTINSTVKENQKSEEEREL